MVLRHDREHAVGSSGRNRERTLRADGFV